MFDVMFLAVLFVTVVGIGAQESVLINEASFQLFVNSLGSDRSSSHRFDNRRTAGAVLGGQHANKFIVKAGPLTSTAFARRAGQFTASLLRIAKEGFIGFCHPSQLLMGFIFNACRILCLQSKAVLRHTPVCFAAFLRLIP